MWESCGSRPRRDPNPPSGRLAFSLSHLNKGDDSMANHSWRRGCTFRPSGDAFEITNCDLKERRRPRTQ
jgi:hypothetical protein